MGKFTCPYCYGEHDLSSCRMTCSYNIAGAMADTCARGVTKDDDGWIPQPYKSKCIKCQDARKRIFCPSFEVNREIPVGFLDSKSLPIALIGAKASGKSNYIAVLINEIKKKMTSRFNCSLDICCSEESKRAYDDYYYNPLFRDGEVVQATDAATEMPPLIFPLRFMDRKNRIKNVATLTFYDTAGENLDSADSIDIMTRYIPNAQGIILLLDPLQVGSIRKHLEGKIPLPEVNSDVVDVLSRVIQSIRNVKNIRGTIKIPLALCFTKIDVLEQFGILPEGSCLCEESEHLRLGSFVWSDFENTNIEMRDILANWLDDEIVQMMRQFSSYSIFGLTALGGPPNGSMLANGGIKPKRVLDPLLWLLAEHKYIDTVGKRRQNIC